MLLLVAMAPSIPASAASETGRYIVALRRGADAEDVARKHADRYGVKADRFYGQAINGYAARVRKDRVAALEKDSSVLMVSPNRIFRAAAQTVPNGVRRIEAHTVPGTGEGVQVAVLDTGIDVHHPDIGPNILGGKYCPLEGEAPTGSFDDLNGHGTHVAGTIAALDNTIGVRGVAPKAKVWAVRVLDHTGAGDTLSLLCGLDFVFTHAQFNGGFISIANMSIQAEIPNVDDGNCGLDIGDILHLAICDVVSVGVTFVVAAGNQNQSGPNIKDVAPAAYDEVITVTALEDLDGEPCGQHADPDDDTFWTFSNFATLSSDLAHTIGAPGVNIESLAPDASSTFVSSGTSMASPHVAGVAARYFETHPGAKPAEMLAVLKATGEAEGVDFNGECSGLAFSHTDPSNDHPEPVVRPADWSLVPDSETPGIVRGSLWALNDGYLGNPDHVFSYGRSSDKVVVGDWDGDGISTPGIIRGNTWFLNDDFDAFAEHVFNFGSSTDRPIIGDWNVSRPGDEPGIVRGNVWYLNYDLNAFADEVFSYGTATDKIVAGNWDGSEDGSDGPGIVRGNRWFINNGLDPNADDVFLFGASTDSPIVGDWDAEGRDRPGIRRGNRWFLNLGFDPNAELVFYFGLSSDRAVVGDWDGEDPP